MWTHVSTNAKNKLQRICSLLWPDARLTLPPIRRYSCDFDLISSDLLATNFKTRNIGNTYNVP